MKKPFVWLLVVFALTLALRLFFAFKAPYFTDDHAYFVMRQVMHIRATGLPLYNDALSYGGRLNIFLPLYYYALAVFTFFMPVNQVLLIIPNIFASCLVFIVYLITLFLTKSNRTALFTSAISSVIPIFASDTIASASPFTLAVPLMFLVVYLLMRQDSAMPFIIFLVLLALTDAITIVLVLGFVLYIIFARFESISLERRQTELTLFSVFFIVWSYFLIFKKPFLSYGALAIKQNIPQELLVKYFRPVTVLSSINLIGLIPILIGIFILYRYLFSTKDKQIYLLTGIAVSSGILLWAQLISSSVGLMILGVILVLFVGKFLKVFSDYVDQTRFVSARPYFILGAILLFVATSLMPTMFYVTEEMKRGFTSDEVQAMAWMSNNTEKSDMILANLREGNLVTALAKRPVMMDTNFLLIRDVDKRLADLDTIFSTKSEIEAVELLTRYKVNYIYLSDYSRLQYKKTSLPYTDDYNCFQLVYDKGVQIFKSTCVLVSQK